MTEELAISKDDVFHLLQNPRRRAVLRYLRDQEDSQNRYTLRDVAEEVGAWEHDTTVRELTSTQRQRVYIALYQSHLPKLDDYGVIDYNQDRGTIEVTPLLDVFEPYLGEGLHEADNCLTVAAKRDEGDGSGLTHTVTALLQK